MADGGVNNVKNCEYFCSLRGPPKQRPTQSSLIEPFGPWQIMTILTYRVEIVGHVYLLQPTCMARRVTESVVCTIGYDLGVSKSRTFPEDNGKSMSLEI